MAEPDLLARLVRRAIGAGEPEPAAAPLEPPSPAAASPAAEAPAFDDAALGILAEKVLLAWLRNRYQLLFPFALDLRRLDERQAALFLHAMVAAAQADGSLDRRERDRLEGTLRLVNPSAEERAVLDEVLARPRPLNEILAEVRDVETAALVYAASLMAVDRRQPVNRYFLKYLAARLQLSEELAGSLEQRYR